MINKLYKDFFIGFGIASLIISLFLVFFESGTSRDWAMIIIILGIIYGVGSIFISRAWDLKQSSNNSAVIITIIIGIIWLAITYYLVIPAELKSVGILMTFSFIFIVIFLLLAFVNYLMAKKETELLNSLIKK